MTGTTRNRRTALLASLALSLAAASGAHGEEATQTRVSPGPLLCDVND